MVIFADKSVKSEVLNMCARNKGSLFIRFLETGNFWSKSNEAIKIKTLTLRDLAFEKGCLLVLIVSTLFINRFYQR